jgi:hypothetical protein
MADKKLNIKVSTTGASKSQKNLKGLSGSIKTLGKAALATGAAYFATRGLINGFSSALRLAGEQEQAEKKLEVALGKTSRALLDHASALQKMTTFGDEAIIGVQSSLAAFIKDEEQIKKATEATLDMAVAMGMDLKAAGDLVAKTLGSSTNAMSRYGIQVEGAVGSTERLESLTNNVATLFGGQAKAQADTYAGSVEQMKNSLGDMGEQIGAIIIPVFEKLEPHLSLAIDFWSKYFGSLKDGDSTSSDFSIQVKELNKQIEDQASLVDYIGGESYRTFVMIKKRANAEGVTFAEQLATDNELYKEAIDKLDDLNRGKEKQLEIEKALKETMQINLQLRRAEIDMGIEYVKVIDITRGAIKNKYAEEMKGAALSGQSAIEAMKSVVRAETMEAVAGYLASVLKTVPFPANLIFAAAGGGVVAGLMDKALGAIPNQFATGADFITSGATPMLVGEGGPERVSVTPLTPGMNKNGPGGITINVGRFIGSQENADELANIIENRSRLGFNRIATHA